MKYTAEEVERLIGEGEGNGRGWADEMLRAFAARLRQDEARGPAWAGVNDKCTYEEIHEHAAKFAREGDSKTARMLHTLASRIRQDEEEAKRESIISTVGFYEDRIHFDGEIPSNWNPGDRVKITREAGR